MAIQNAEKGDVKLMSKKIRELLNELSAWETQARATNPTFKGFEEEQAKVLEFIEVIAKETNLERVDELKKKVTALTRTIFKINQEVLKLFKDRKKLLESQEKTQEQTQEVVAENKPEEEVKAE